MSGFFDDLTDALSPWKSADLGCMAIRKVPAYVQMPDKIEDTGPTSYFEKEEMAGLEREKAEMMDKCRDSLDLIMLIEAAIERREYALRNQGETAGGTPAIPKGASIGRLAIEAYTDQALAREELVAVDLSTARVDMAELLPRNAFDPAYATTSAAHAERSTAKMGKFLTMPNADAYSSYSNEDAGPYYEEKGDGSDYYEYSYLTSEDGQNQKGAPPAPPPGPVKALYDVNETPSPPPSATADSGRDENDDPYAAVPGSRWNAWAEQRASRSARQRSDALEKHTAALSSGRLSASGEAEMGEEAFAAQCVQSLKQGSHATILMSKQQTAAAVRLSLASDGSELTWTFQDVAVAAGSVRVSEIRSVVYVGADLNLPPPEDEATRPDYTRFAVVTASETFNLAIADARTLQHFVCGLRFLAGKPVDRRAFLWQRAAAVNREKLLMSSFDAKLDGLTDYLVKQSAAMGKKK